MSDKFKTNTSHNEEGVTECGGTGLWQEGQSRGVWLGDFLWCAQLEQYRGDTQSGLEHLAGAGLVREDGHLDAGRAAYSC